MAISRRFGWLISACVLASVASVTVAQGRGHDRDDGPPGQAKKHGDDDRGMPPGQAKKYRDDDERRMPPGQAKKYEEDGRWMPPGQAKKLFRDQDRDNFYAHYRHDADHWRGHRRIVFVPGQVIERTYYVQPVPRTYWVGVAPPPPPGYQYGYYQGYVVAYNPTTRVVGDVLDLVMAASGH